jgi:O-antigen/teichoic acid export membrane protein
MLRGFFWLGTSTFLGQFVSWLSTLVVIRLLSPSDYGLMAMTTVFTSLLTLISQMGVSSALVQTKELTEHQKRQIFGWVVITGLASVVVTYAAAPAIARFYREPSLVVLVRVLSVNMIVMTLYVVPQAMFIREMNFKAKAQIDLWATIAATVVTLTLAMKGMGVWALVAGLMTLQAVKAVAFNLARRQWIAPSFDLRGSRGLLGYGLMVTWDRLLNFLYLEADKIIVGRFLGNAVLGTYSVALALASIPLDKVLPIVTQVSFASYSRVQGDLARIRSTVLQTTRVVSLTCFPTFFGMTAVAPLAVPLILGENWAPIVVPFQVICLSLPFKALAPLLPPVVFAMGRPAVNVVNVAIMAVSMSIASLIGVSNGLIGVCIAWAAVFPLVFVVVSVRSLRVIGIPALEYFREIRFPFVASALMLATIQLVERVVEMPRPIYSLVLVIVFGVAFYAGSVSMFRRRDVVAIWSLLRRRRGGSGRVPDPVEKSA